MLVSSALGGEARYGERGWGACWLHVDGFVGLLVFGLRVEIYHMYGDYGPAWGDRGFGVLVTHT